MEHNHTSTPTPPSLDLPLMVSTPSSMQLLERKERNSSHMTAICPPCFCSGQKNQLPCLRHELQFFGAGEHGMWVNMVTEIKITGFHHIHFILKLLNYWSYKCKKTNLHFLSFIQSMTTYINRSFYRGKIFTLIIFPVRNCYSAGHSNVPFWWRRIPHFPVKTIF